LGWFATAHVSSDLFAAASARFRRSDGELDGHEERDLLNTFGSTDAGYKSRVPMLIPSLSGRSRETVDAMMVDAR